MFQTPLDKSLSPYAIHPATFLWVHPPEHRRPKDGGDRIEPQVRRHGLEIPGSNLWKGPRWRRLRGWQLFGRPSAPLAVICAAAAVSLPGPLQAATVQPKPAIVLDALFIKAIGEFEPNSASRIPQKESRSLATPGDSPDLDFDTAVEVLLETPGRISARAQNDSSVDVGVESAGTGTWTAEATYNVLHRNDFGSVKKALYFTEIPEFGLSIIGADLGKGHSGRVGVELATAIFDADGDLVRSDLVYDYWLSFDKVLDSRPGLKYNMSEDLTRAVDVQNVAISVFSFPAIGGGETYSIPAFKSGFVSDFIPSGGWIEFDIFASATVDVPNESLAREYGALARIGDPFGLGSAPILSVDVADDDTPPPVDPTPAPIPLPAGAWLLISGIVALTGFGARRPRRRGTAAGVAGG